MKRFMFATATLIAAGCSSTQTTTKNDPAPTYPPQSYQTERLADFTGPRGPDGPVGATGPQGPTGQTGPAGYAMAGSRGPEGPAGAMGEQGRTGPQGPAGDLAVGPAGAAGPAGNTGAQGSMGQTGAQGASADGFAGPAGPAGLAGAQGPTGEMGSKGPTTVGPAGPAGLAGATGAQGQTGQAGAQGSTTAGVAGATGAAGGAGPHGPIGPTGPQGLAGMVDRWVSYRDFWFDTNNAVIHDADAGKVADIAAYMKKNPSLQVGIDTSSNASGASQANIDLVNRRGLAVRNALIAAGVPASSIKTGTFGDADLRRDGRVEVLIMTDRVALAQVAPTSPTGVVQHWTSYRDFWFDVDKAVIHEDDASKVTDIATYMKNQPSQRLAIDSSMNPNSTDQGSIDLANRRGSAIRNALIAAGVPAASIQSGSFGDTRLWREGRVEVLIKTDQVAQAN
jgi:outer membrane protein OmpA-like peptidoglycan-associated protein